jgi:hypothetical protein
MQMRKILIEMVVACGSCLRDVNDFVVGCEIQDVAVSDSFVEHISEGLRLKCAKESRLHLFIWSTRIIKALCCRK